MTRSSKHQNFIKCSLDSGKKGTLVIRKTNRSFRRHRAANIAAANAAKKKEVEEVMSDLTPQTTYTRSTISTNTSIIEKGRYKKYGSSLEEFMEGNLDWRSFGSITYNEMKEVGLFDAFKKKTVDFMKARTNASSKDLPLSEAGSRQLDQKMRVIKAMLDPSGRSNMQTSKDEKQYQCCEEKVTSRMGARQRQPSEKTLISHLSKARGCGAPVQSCAMLLCILCPIQGRGFQVTEEWTRRDL